MIELSSYYQKNSRYSHWRSEIDDLEISRIKKYWHSIEVEAVRIVLHRDYIVRIMSPIELLLAVYMATSDSFGSFKYLLEEKKEEVESELVDLAHYAIANGANAHFSVEESMMLLDYPSHSRELIKLLLSHGAHCTHDLDGRLFDSSLLFFQKFSNLNAPKTEELKIPHTLFHIWLTSENHPREIKDKDIEITIHNKNFFNQQEEKWEHVVWTNNKDLIPASVQKLEARGIKVKSIIDHKEDLKLIETIATLVAKSYWGLASDLLRLSIAEAFGGAYCDLNYTFHRHINIETYTYNFVATSDASRDIHVNVFAASSHHPVLQRTIAQQENIEHYDQRNGLKKLYIAFLDSYITEANKNGNVDVIYGGNNYRFPEFPLINEDLSCPAKYIDMILFKEYKEIMLSLPKLGVDQYGEQTWLEL